MKLGTPSDTAAPTATAWPRDWLEQLEPIRTESSSSGTGCVFSTMPGIDLLKCSVLRRRSWARWRKVVKSLLEGGWCGVKGVLRRCSAFDVGDSSRVAFENAVSGVLKCQGLPTLSWPMHAQHYQTKSCPPYIIKCGGIYYRSSWEPKYLLFVACGWTTILRWSRLQRSPMLIWRHGFA